MFITGRIIKALPKQSGISQRTGNEWASQDFVLEYFENQNDRFPDRLVFHVQGAERLKEWNIQEGEENVTVGVGHKANEYNGRYYNEINAFSFTRNAQQQPPQHLNQPAQTANQPAGAAQPSTAGNYPNQQAFAPQNAQNMQAAQPTQQPLFGQQPAQNPQNPSNDDLPF